jgi:hypothetical protein
MCAAAVAKKQSAATHIVVGSDQSVHSHPTFSAELYRQPRRGSHMIKILIFAARAAMSIPVLPAPGSILTNRRKPSSKICAPADVAMNVSDRFYSWMNRWPGGGQSAVVRDKNGKVSGSINRLP